MKYDFDRSISRKNTDCAKWDGALSLFGSPEVIPMWVADMDIPIAKPITDAIKKRADHEIYGYSLPRPASVVDAVIYRMQKRCGWKVNPEWIVFTPGIVPALYAAVKAYTHPGDEVILQDPVYHPFWNVIKNNGCHVVNNKLVLQNGRYGMDLEGLDACFAIRHGRPPIPHRIRLMLLCSPHNPVGRVWTKEELIRTGEIVIRHNAIIVSDEVHGELLFPDITHTPFAALSEEFEQNSITCISPSKTFNLAGLEASVVIIPNAGLRKQFQEARKGILPGVNVFGFVAMEAAYRYGDEWLGQFLVYLHKNYEFLFDYFEKKIPKIKVIQPEGTYLIWLDCRELGFDPVYLRDFMAKEAKVGLDEGYLFGQGGEGFMRMNIACPRFVLSEALRRIENAVKNL
ncbi:cystathionine beta-lyase PatB [Candidatus Kuenenia stuttgartiensis]|jgi:cystathionine beta-lyase|nr:PatB family C-S lyase [Candidatus Kuenenia stuttgartiensis]QII13542.1 cystathionine beta-lyase PatB [Candidatus Kuenenia stuttgartiensis]TVL95491.1 MAG: cystathionine beta-lyase [Candidatus Kuenenia stuttgartiensis]